jgi:hypothetical protein
MNLDIDTILAIHHKWDLTVTVDGKDYQTVRPSIGAIGALTKAKGLSEEQLRATLASLFTEPAPDFSAWDAKRLTAFLNGYAAYFKGRIDSEKKLEAVAQAAAAMVSPAI